MDITESTIGPTMIRCPEQPPAEEMEHIQAIEWWFDAIIHIILSVIGLISNIISMPVLLSKRLTNQFYRTLAVLAIFDIIFITCDVLESIRRNHYDSESTCAHVPVYQTLHTYIFPKFLRPIQNITMVASIYTTVVVALGRYLAVSKPISTMVNSGTGNWKTVFIYILPVLCFSIAFKLPIFFEFYTEWCTKFCVGDNLNPKHTMCGSHLSNMTGNDIIPLPDGSSTMVVGKRKMINILA